MKKVQLIVVVCLFCFFNSCDFNSESGNQDVQPYQVKTAETFSDLADMYKNDEHVTVINFWATSCPPCIKEMPHFRKLDDTYEGKDVRVLLVSLDMKRDLESRVKPFLEKYEITPEVVLLADQNYSSWTEKIDSSWYGALPATIILSKLKSKFFMGAFETYEELNDELEAFL